MNHGNSYLAHQGGIPMQHPQQHLPPHHHQHHQHAQHLHHQQQQQHQHQHQHVQHQAKAEQQQQYHRQAQAHEQLQMPPQPPTATQLIDNPRSSPAKQSPLLQVRPKYVEEQLKGKSNPIPQKEMAKLRESYLKQRFALIVMQRQLHVANSRLTCALEGLKLAKESKPFHKFYVQAMDEKRHIKSVPKSKGGAKGDPEVKKNKSGRQTKMVTTKKGERQRPFKYSTRSKDEMTVISCAADYVVAGTATLAQAKDALREMGIFDFETSLSNKMYNHPDKKYYLKMRKERREEKKVENTKKTEARLLRKKNKQRETELREQRKRQKRQKKTQVQHQPMIHDVQPGAHLAYGHPAHLQQAVPQHIYAHHDMHGHRI